MMRLWIMAVMFCAGSAAPAAVLYDGSAGTLPGSQGWTYLTNPFVGATATQSLVSGGVRLDSTPATAESAGYFSTLHPSVPTLDRSTGFTVRIDLKVLADIHAGSDKNADSIDDRAGFSVIALSSDHKGVELGFWSDRLWAQDTSFHHAEEGLINTTSASRRYDIAIKDNAYWVMADNAYLFGGPIRDYSGFGAPYTSNNFIFWGDDTSSAAGSTEVSRVEALTTAVPEPGSAAVAVLLVLPAILRRRARA